MCRKLGCDFKIKEPLKNHTSFKIGGPADLFIYVNNEFSLTELLKFMKSNGVPFFVLGNGSNLLVADNGYRGVVLSLSKGFKSIYKENNVVNCGAGVPLARACVFSMQNHLSGLEFAWGIPGSCGGALFMNAGAYGSDISNIVCEATHITPEGVVQTLHKDDMKLSYRKSIYSENLLTVVSMKLELKDSSPELIRSQMYETILKRKSKQPLEYPSAGSVFKRPGNGYYAGALIEDAGLKGTSIGGAMVSTKHSGFIVNTGNATAKDISNLIRLVKEKVYDKSGILLECEVKTLGDIEI